MPDRAYPTLVEALRDCERNTSYLEEFELQSSDLALRNQTLAAEITRALEHENDLTRIHELMSAAATLYTEVYETAEVHGTQVFDAAVSDAEDVLASGVLPVHIEDQARAAIGERPQLEGPMWMVFARRLRAIVDVDSAREQ